MICEETVNKICYFYEAYQLTLQGFGYPVEASLRFFSDGLQVRVAHDSQHGYRIYHGDFDGPVWQLPDRHVAGKQEAHFRCKRQSAVSEGRIACPQNFVR